MAEFRCDKCKDHGIAYCRTYAPADFIEGDPDSPVWIIGINPAMALDWRDERSRDEMRDGFAALAASNSYYRHFRTVSAWLFEGLGQRGRVAHTDLVKCSSSAWPPPGITGRQASDVASTCSSYLRDQLMRYKPRILICNGSAVCEYILDAVRPVDRKPESTSYSGALDGREIVVVLSGFVGRIDNHAKRRLGREIEDHARRLGLMPA